MHGLQNQVVLVQEPLRADVEEGRFRRKSTCDVKERVPVRKLVWLGGRGMGEWRERCRRKLVSSLGLTAMLENLGFPFAGRENSYPVK